MHRTIILTVIAIFAIIPSSRAQDAKPIRLIAEAEDFTVEKGPWQRVAFRDNYFAGTFAITFLSRMACLGAPAQIAGPDAVATQRIDIPANGEFHVMARYEQPYNFTAEFSVEIDQGGRTVYRQVFGRLEDPKIWAFTGHKRVPMERYGWGGTDNIVWQQKETARLSRGPATLRLIAGAHGCGLQPFRADRDGCPATAAAGD
jgi:hypothetical protein